MKNKIMTPKNKEILLKYICMALPYGIKIMVEGWDSDIDCEFTTIETLIGIDDRFIHTIWDKTGDKDKHYIMEPKSILDYKPFLRPMSSMAEEEIIEFNNIPSTKNYQIVNGDLPWDVANYKQIGWLLKNHFDFMGLIPEGLAIEVTKDDNPYEHY